jgi:hypothetical protein
MKLEDGYTSNLDIAASLGIKTIKGINNFLLGQRLKYKGVLDPEEQLTFQEALSNNEAYEETDANYGIETATVNDENNNYLTINDTAGRSLKPNPILGNKHFLHKYPERKVEKIKDEITGEETGEEKIIIAEGDTEKSIRDLSSIDILNGPDDNQDVYNSGPKQVLKSNTVDEFYLDKGNIEVLGSNINVLGSTGLGGMVSQATSLSVNAINTVSNIFNQGDAIKMFGDDDKLYSDNSALDTKKNAFLKSINLQYANSKIYNRLVNVANGAASAANPLAPQNFNFDINHMDSFGQPFVNWWSNFAGDKELNPTFLELLELDTANFNTMSLLNAKPEISIKHKKNQRVKGGLVNEDGTKAKNTTTLRNQPIRRIEPGNEDIDSDGLALSILDSNIKDPPRLDVYPENSNFNHYANYTTSYAINSFKYPEASQELDENYRKFIDSQFIDLWNFSINTIRSDDDLRTIKHLIMNSKSHTITETQYDKAMVPYYSTLKSEEESMQIQALVEKNNNLKELGYLYVRPYPGTFRYTVKNNDKYDEHSFNFENFTIPFEFQPKISEASTTVQYATEEMLNHTGSLRTYIRTEPGVVTLETEYLALCENSNEINSGDNDVSKNFGVDAWQYLWDLKRIDNIEKAYRSLAFPVNSQSTVTPGIIKPPMIKILMQTDPNKELTVGNLYRYPYTKYNDEYNYLGDSKTTGFYLQNMQIDNRDQFKTYKTYICTDVNISYDDEKFAMTVPSAFRIKNTKSTNAESTGAESTNVYENLSVNPIYKIERSTTSHYQFRGFKVTLNLVEITENYLDAIPDFAAYYVKYKQELIGGEENTYLKNFSTIKGSKDETSFNDFLQITTSDLILMANEIGNIKEAELKFKNKQEDVIEKLNNKKIELENFNNTYQKDIDITNDLKEIETQIFNDAYLVNNAEENLVLFDEKIDTITSLLSFGSLESPNLPGSKSVESVEKILKDYEADEFLATYIKDAFKKKNLISSDGKYYNCSYNDFEKIVQEYYDYEDPTNPNTYKNMKSSLQTKFNNAKSDAETNLKTKQGLENDYSNQGLDVPVKEVLPNGTIFKGSKGDFLVKKQQQLESEKQSLEKLNDQIADFIGGVKSNGTIMEEEETILSKAQKSIIDYVQYTSVNVINSENNNKNLQSTLQDVINNITTKVNEIPG